MTASYSSTATVDTHQAGERWSRFATATILDAYDAPENSSFSQRQFAQSQGVPRTSLQYWLCEHQQDSDLDPQVVSFFHSPSGQIVLRDIVGGLFLVFQQSQVCGIRPLGQFLHLSKLDRFVASSYSALHKLADFFQSQLPVFAQEERERLGPSMPAKRIAVCPDENFHGHKICLVAIEPVSNFILVETYASQRDSATWNAQLQSAIEGLPLTIVQFTSDQAGALEASAKQFEAVFCPDLFHGQHDLHKHITFPLNHQCQNAQSQVKQAEKCLKELETKQQAQEGQPRGPGRPIEFEQRIAEQTQKREEALDRLEEASRHKEQAKAAIQGLGDDFHPFDATTGAMQQVEQVAEKMTERMNQLAAVVEAAQLPEKAQEEVKRGRSWLLLLLVPFSWWLGIMKKWLGGLALSEDQEEVIREKLLSGLYWEMAAEKARDAEHKQKLSELAAKLLEEAWQEGSPLWRLSEEQRERIKQQGREIVGLFQRSSSCVEGRNGRLSLLHHGKAGLTPQSLAALTVIHNYLATREDGTTAAERFFGQKPRDLFAWLIDRMPDLPRPASKRCN